MTRPVGIILSRHWACAGHCLARWALPYGEHGSSLAISGGEWAGSGPPAQPSGFTPGEYCCFRQLVQPEPLDNFDVAVALVEGSRAY